MKNKKKGLYGYITKCLDRIKITDNIEECYQLEIYLRTYIKKYVAENEERLKKEGS